MFSCNLNHAKSHHILILQNTELGFKIFLGKWVHNTLDGREILAGKSLFWTSIHSIKEIQSIITAKY